ncbi:HigA family addiction module antitoxin [Hyphobacterium sp.]|jgi:addiction module HigA family antidote|uniref:HigA family addiction module antitoxin n=1 Tax=Hyphobacterium sp. TaxID=2004662 RepID=UPI003BAB96A5
MRITTHPGEVLREEFMAPHGVSINKLAGDLDIPVSRVSDIVNARRAVTADTALRLATYFKTSPEFWLNLQSAFELSKLQADKGKQIVASIREPARPFTTET